MVLFHACLLLPALLSSVPGFTPVHRISTSGVQSNNLSYKTGHAHHRPHLNRPPQLQLSATRSRPTGDAPTAQSLWRQVQLSLAVLAAAVVVVATPAFAENELAKQYGDGASFNPSLVDGECFVNKCQAPTQSCIDNPDCTKGLTCTAKCMGDTKCITGCFAKFGNQNLNDLLACSVEVNDCIHIAILPPGPDKPHEIPSPPIPAVANFNPDSLNGKWYKVMGWDSNYDCFDFQVNKFQKGENNNEVSVDVDFYMPRQLRGSRNPSYNHQHLTETLTFDKDSVRTAHTEGHMFGLTFWENWYVIGEGGRDAKSEFKVVYYTGRTLQNTYEGAFVYSRQPQLPDASMPEVFKLAEKAGMKPQDWCYIKNTPLKSSGLDPLLEQLGPVRDQIDNIIVPSAFAGDETDLLGLQEQSKPKKPEGLKAAWNEVLDYLEDPKVAAKWTYDQQIKMGDLLPPHMFNSR